MIVNNENKESGHEERCCYHSLEIPNDHLSRQKLIASAGKELIYDAISI